MTDRSQTWVLRGLALAIAVAAWFMVSVEGRNEVVSERKIDASVTYRKPEGLVILNPVDKVSVLVRGPEEAVRRLAPYMVDLQVSISETRPGTMSVSLDPENVRLPRGEELRVVSIDPNVLHLQVDKQVTRTLPLRPSFTGEPAAGARVRRDLVEIVPNFAVVTGPESILKNVSVLDLSPISLEGHAQSFEETASVISPNPLVQVVENSRVTVQVPTDLGSTEGGKPRAGAP